MSQHGALPESLSDERAHKLKQYASIGGIVVGTILIILAFSFYYGDLHEHKKTKSTSNADFHPGRDIGLLVSGLVLAMLGLRSVYLPPASK